jgi:acetyl-CoA carboxylase carboxyl transferase subunit beta
MPDGWFRRKQSASSKRSLQARVQAIPEGLWTPCPRCRELLFTRELEKSLKVCKKCNYHVWLTAAERIDLLLDEGTFVERDENLRTVDPLGFPKYDEKLARYQEATGMTEAVLSGEGELLGMPVAIGVTDARFIRGSMGSVVGERITRAIERAIEREIAVILVSGSGGGARMEEGLLSLMQMAKTSGALARLHQAGLLAIGVLTDQSMAGVLASWASLGDVILAEPGARIGFVGERVSQQAQVTKQTSEYQTSEFQLKHGMIDMVCHRKDLKEAIGRLLQFAGVVRREERLEAAHAG